MSTTNNFKGNIQQTQSEWMQFEQKSNENQFNESQLWRNDSVLQSNKPQLSPQQLLNNPMDNSETLLLGPVDLTYHCECVGEPLTPTLPKLTEEWFEDCIKYQQDGPSYESLKKLRHMPFQPHLVHDNSDFRILMINMYIDDYNQRLLEMRQPKELQISNTIEDDIQLVSLREHNQHNSDWVLDLAKQEQQSHMGEGQYMQNYGIANQVYGYDCNSYNQHQMANPIPQNYEYFNQPQREHQQDFGMCHNSQESLNQCMKCLLRLRYSLLTAYSNQFYSGLMVPNGYNQPELRINICYPYLQTPIDEKTYMYSF